MRMRHVCRGGASGVVVAASLVLGAMPVSAAPGDGSASAAEVTMTLLGEPAVHVGPLAPASTGGQANGDAAGVNASGHVVAGAATTSATRDEETGAVQAQADITDVGIRIPELAGTFGAINATCEATHGGGTGVSVLANGRIGGVVVGAHPAPNTTVDLAAAKVVFNEQIQHADGSLTVNAVHIYLNPLVGSGYVILAQARCGLAAQPVPLASGAGLWLGLGLLALAAVPAALIVVRRLRAE